MRHHKHLAVCLFAAVAFLWLPGLLRAQARNPLLDLVDAHLNVEYAKVGDRSLVLDLYLPKGAAKPMPVVMWIHGGGWKEGNKDNPWPLPLVKDGFAVASVDYRLSQEAIWPAQIYDCKAAVRFLRAHAADYGFNPDAIGVAGASAGGHLVALLGTTAQNPELEGNEGNPGVSSRVQAVGDFFGPTDFLMMVGPDRKWDKAYAVSVVSQLLGGPVEQKSDLARQASPLYYVTAQACPFYIAHGDNDQTVPVEQSIEFNAALQKAGVTSTLHIVKGAGHGFNDPTVTQEITDFFRHYLPVPKP